MKSAASIPSKLDVVKLKTYDFLENERLGSDRMHERNIRNDASHHTNDELTPDQTIKPNNEDEEPPVESTECKLELVEDLDCSRFDKSKNHISEAVLVIDNRTNYVLGSAPKRYTTSCFIQLKQVPYRYTESVIIDIGKKKKTYQNKVFFKQKYVPLKWSEKMCTEISTFPKCILSQRDNTLEDNFIELRAAT